jgi:hypothetical protein
MNAWIRKLHLYAGLFNFSLLMVFGIAGLVATAHAPDIFQQPSVHTITTQSFSVSPSSSDKEVVAAIVDALHVSVGQLPNSRRNPQHQLMVDFYDPNGLRRVTLLETEHLLQIETFRNSIWRFFDNLHATTLHEGAPWTAQRLWGWYIEIATLSMIWMIASGIWLGLAQRWNSRWTQFSTGVAVVAFVVLYYLEK